MKTLYIHQISNPTELRIPVENSVFKQVEHPTRVVFVGKESPLSDLNPRLFGMAFAKADIVEIFQCGPNGMRRSYAVLTNIRKINKPFTADGLVGVVDN